MAVNPRAKAFFSLNRAGSTLRAASKAFAARAVRPESDGGSAPAAGHSTADVPRLDLAGDARKRASRAALFLALLGGLVAALLLAASPVRAALTHPFESAFTASDSPAGSFSADKVGIDQSTGNVYVIDKANDVLDKFNSSGSYLSQINFGSWGSDPDIAVDNSATGTQGHVAAAAEFGPVRVFDSSGAQLFQIPVSGNTTPDGAFDDNCGLAINPSNGDIYVAEYGQQAIDKFDSAGNFITQFSVGFSVCDIAVDTDGTIYAVQWNSSLHKVDSSGTDLGVIDNQVSGGPGAVNIDPSNHHVYFDRGNSFAEYDAGAQNLITLSGTADLASGSRGIDVNGTTGKVYASNGTRVAIFGVGVVVPTVITGAATNLTASAATLNGTVNPDGVQVTDCHFDYGTTTAYELGSVPCVETPAQIGSGSSDVPVHADVTGLTSETTYHFRLVGVNANGTNHGQDQTFTTLGALGATTDPATNITKTSATLNGSVNPLGAQVTDCHFDYGTTTQYGQTAPCAEDAGSGNSFVPVHADISGLTAGTTYHFRLVATTANGTKQANDRTFTTTPPLLATTAAATNVGQATATLNGSVNPLGDAVTNCHFDYGTDTNYGQTAPCAETVGSGTSAVPVHADISGLTPGTVYHFRLVATNALGTGQGSDMSFRTLTPPTIVSISSCVEPQGALLFARVEAGFDPTATFHFDYGTDTNYGTSTPDQIIDPSGGNVPQTMFVELTGLQANTTYHFRGVAQNVVGPTSTPDQSFSTGAPSTCGLPDNRAYEQVSPQDKGGFDVLSADEAAALSGDAASFDSFGSFAGQPTGAGILNSYVATRGSSGWSTEQVSPPIPLNAVFATAIMLDYSPELDQSIGQAGGILGIPTSEPMPIQVRDSSGVFHDVSPGVVSDPNLSPPYPTYDGASSDFSHVVFEIQQAIPGTGAPAYPANNVYEYSGGQVHLVSILPGETPDPNGGTTHAPGQFGGVGDSVPHAVSVDGSRIFWTSNGDGEIYVREDLSSTDQVSDSHKTGGDPNGVKPKRLWMATPDGKFAFFTSAEKLTNDATTGPTSAGNDLYRYDVDSGTLTDLSVDATDANGAQVQGVLRASNDGQRVYFVARGVLAPGATAGQNNLYVRDGATTTFIATLSGSGDESNWNVGEATRTSRATPDGQTLLFTSHNSLTGYDNAGHVEVYRYDLQDGLSCLSCDPTGAAASGDAVLNPPSLFFGLPTEVRNLSQDGSRAFFTSPEALVNHDLNGAPDVYEWEDGKLFLISTGRDKGGAEFANASASGDDVFFFTRQQLVSTDQDDNVDMYDARVGGGFPSAPPVVPCVGEGCKSPASGAPGAPGAGSSTTTGPGNQPKDTTPQAGKKKKKNCKKIKNKQKRKQCKKKNKRRAH